MTTYKPENAANALSFTLAAMFLGAGLFLGVYGFAAWSPAYGSLAAGSFIGIAVFAWRMQQHDIRAWRIIEHAEKISEPRPEQTVVIRSPGPNFVHIANDRTEQFVYQPEPGRFAGFMREAISDKTRIQFSLRQAVSRGWSDKEYAVMVAQLRALNWLTEQTSNDAPVFNRSRIDEVYEFLESLPPHPENARQYSGVQV